jgi:hypothetical protein
MASVYWSRWVKSARPDVVPQIQPLKILIKEPQPILQLINRQADYMNMSGSSCPAVVEFLRDVYVIRAAFDFELRLNEYKNDMLYFGPKVSSNAGVELGYSRSKLTKDKPFTFTSSPDYIFYSNEDVVIEVLPLMLITSNSAKNIAIVPGSFNIGKWIRPLDFTFDVLDVNTPTVIKEGDPLFCIRFRAADGKKIKLEHREVTKEIEDAADTCVNLKMFKKRLPLAASYEIVKDYIRKLSFMKRCPWHK